MRAGEAPTYETLLQCVPEDEREVLSSLVTDLRSDVIKFALEHRIVRRDGSVRFVYQQAEAIYDEGNIVSFHGTVQDITERKAHEAQIEFLANHDALTELPNRRSWDARVTDHLAWAARNDRHHGRWVIETKGRTLPD